MHNARCGMAVANSANPEDNPYPSRKLLRFSLRICEKCCIFVAEIIKTYQYEEATFTPLIGFAADSG